MSVIAARKCVRHSGREAIARCPACREDFCRECVIEHEGVLLCAPCLAREAAAKNRKESSSRWRMGSVILTVLCVVLLWVVFYGFGQFLKMIPADVHEGTVWRRLDT
jgi:hypothetical protein